MNLHAGTSGFSYPNWRGRFYPEGLAGSRMLGYYAERLNGVELNGSFYRMPKPELPKAWAAVPAGFRFCFKAHRGLTYSAEGFDRAGLARLFAERIEPLRSLLGPVLLQFPPVRKRDPGLLDALLEALAGPVAAEFRDDGWFAEDVYAVLRRRGAALVVTDDAGWPMAPDQELSGLAYYRLRRDYDADDLRRWAGRLRPRLASAAEVHVYFKHEPEAPERALALTGMLET